MGTTKAACQAFLEMKSRPGENWKNESRLVHSCRALVADSNRPHASKVKVLLKVCDRAQTGRIVHKSPGRLASYPARAVELDVYLLQEAVMRVHHDVLPMPVDFRIRSGISCAREGG